MKSGIWYVDVESGIVVISSGASNRNLSLLFRMLYLRAIHDRGPLGTRPLNYNGETLLSFGVYFKLGVKMMSRVRELGENANDPDVVIKYLLGYLFLRIYLFL